MTESNVRSSGGPGSVSTGTSSGKSGTVSADARVPYKSAKCSSETDRGSADPPKRPLGVPPIPTKWHLWVQRLPPKAHLRVQQVHYKPRPRKMMNHLRGAHLLRWGWMGSWWTSRGFGTPGAPLLPAGPRCHPSQKFQTGRARRRGN